MAPVETDEEDAILAARLLEQKTPEEIAAALVHVHRASLPQPEELLIDTGPAPRPGREERADRGPRPGFEDTVWFRMDVGRRQNADPRWLLPLLCRRGHITKTEIGAIRINPTETFVEIPRAIADRFADALQRTAQPDREDESGIAIVPAPNGPAQPDRSPPRGGPRSGPHGGPRSRPHDGPPPRKQLAPRGDGPRPPRSDGPRGPSRPGGPGRPGGAGGKGRSFPPQAGGRPPFKGKPPKR